MSEIELTPAFFGHANGFPAHSYRSLFQSLSSHLDIHAVEIIGHDEAYPVAPRWEGLVDQYCDELYRQWQGQPVFGFGHSMGAILTFLAAQRYPHWFKHIYLMEPPLILGFNSLVMRCAQWLGRGDSLTPAAKTLGRREQWPDISSARDYFESRPLFQNWDGRCLQDYLAAGLIEKQGQFRLAFEVDREIEIYRETPLNLGKYPPLQVTGTLIGGEQSKLLTPSFKSFAAKHGMRFEVIPGGHLFPFEYPERTANLIKREL